MMVSGTIERIIYVVPRKYHMKLQRQKAYKYKDKVHHKYVIVVKENLIKALGWREGDELEGEEKKGELLIRRA